MGRLDMHTLQEFVRLARMGTGFRAIARMVRISPNTEREYRKALDAAGLLVGDPNDLPEPATLLAALEKHRPTRLAPQQESSVERWATEVKAMHELGAKPVAIFDRLRLEHKDFTAAVPGGPCAARREGQGRSGESARVSRGPGLGFGP